MTSPGPTPHTTPPTQHVSGDLSSELQQHREADMKAAHSQYQTALKNARDLSNPKSQAYKDAKASWEQNNPTGQDYVTQSAKAQQILTDCENTQGWSAQACKQSPDYRKAMAAANKDLHSFNVGQEKLTDQGEAAAQKAYHDALKTIASQDLTHGQLAGEINSSRESQFDAAKKTEDQAIAKAKELSDPKNQAYKDAKASWEQNNPTGQDYAKEIAKAQQILLDCENTEGWSAQTCKQAPDYKKAIAAANKDLQSFNKGQEALTDQGITAAQKAYSQQVATIKANDPTLAQLDASAEKGLDAQASAAKKTEDQAIAKAKELSDPKSQAYKDAKASWEQNNPTGQDYAKEIAKAQQILTDCEENLGWSAQTCKQSPDYKKAIAAANKDLQSFNTAQEALTAQGVSAAQAAYKTALAQINTTGQAAADQAELNKACGELSGAQQTNCQNLDNTINPPPPSYSNLKIMKGAETGGRPVLPQ